MNRFMTLVSTLHNFLKSHLCIIIVCTALGFALFQDTELGRNICHSVHQASTFTALPKSLTNVTTERTQPKQLNSTSIQIPTEYCI